ncbi:hypothetical protein RUM44_004225 [Polyplax serrata]|uniref:Uncharacterized protein n=1 Tax=Polyplax serrata TaxID=468196 RepID=A0ABR1B3T0_POLSC
MSEKKLVDHVDVSSKEQIHFLKTSTSRQRVLLETASIAGGATIAVFLVVIACVTLYLHYQRKSKERRIAGTDRKDGPERDLERRAFNRCLSISMDRLPEEDEKKTVTSIDLGHNNPFEKTVGHDSQDDGERLGLAGSRPGRSWNVIRDMEEDEEVGQGGEAEDDEDEEEIEFLKMKSFPSNLKP